MKDVKIFIGADHAGFDTKEKIRKYFDSKKILYEDFTPEKIEGDDYPDYAFKVARKVARTKNGKGVLVCGTGTGMAIAANKVKGIRAVTPYDKYTAKMSKIDNDANVIALRERGISPSKSLDIVKAWLKAKFSGVKRHKRRIMKINNFKK